MKTVTLFMNETGKTFFEVGSTHKEDSVWYDHTINLPKYWEEKTKLRICTNIEDKPFKIPRTIEDFNIPLLKSSLQKSIRRNNTEAAIQLSLQLISQDLTEFLRRFPIIILEDCVLHPNFASIVWMMIANSKGWKLRKFQIEMLIQTVHDVASCKYRDYLDFNEVEFSNPVYESKNVFLASIILRVNYGGMKGDEEFMKKLTMMWHHRFKKDEKQWNEALSLIFPEIPSEKKLEIASIIEKKLFLKDKYKLNEGIDFHVFPNLLESFWNVLREKKKDFDVNQLKSMIWFHRSGVSFKCFITEKEDLLTLKLQDSFESHELLETFQMWKEIQKDWIDLCSENYWKSFIQDDLDQPKAKKPKIQNHKITDFFKLK
jgi:hypothetical protein